ncbi:hypothetical protein C4565_03655 [Candidatus Parcubacteria bacterium]|nr:MAG: hypothetical protein C4565_03655 [Candidatus Parcubacteria bacterium]
MEMVKRTIPTISLEAQLAAKLLKQKGAEIGAVVSYADLTAAIGCDAQTKGRSAVNTARNKLQAEQGWIFAPIWNEGLKRLSDKEIVDVGESTIHKIKRAARRGFKKLSQVADFEKLDADTRLRHNVTATLLSFVERAATKKTQGRIESAIEKANAPLPFHKMLEAFKNGGKED